MASRATKLPSQKIKKKPSTKQSKPKIAPPATPEERPSSPLIKTTPKWDDAYPFLEETYRVNGELVAVPKYFSSTDRDPTQFDKFLHEVVRLNSSPTFVKNNFKKIRKLIEKEIQHRDKMLEKLSREQRTAFTSYFRDEMYFDRTQDNEYFDHELEKVYVSYLRTYCETGIHEARVRLGNRKRKEILQKYNING